MDASPSASNFCCELKIISAKDVDQLKSSGDHLFIRCYLSAGNDRRVQLNSREIPTNSNPIWDDSFSLECLGTEESINSVRQGNVIFELRSRNKLSSVPIFGKFGGSKLLGRAEFPWKTVFESQNMEIETWVRMILKNGRVTNEHVKPPAVKISMKIRVLEEERSKNPKNDRLRGWDNNNECCCLACNGCHSCADFDIFALGFALEAL
ncbi:hypothetical protein M9H77_19742 [Catharanthus roseus]|uniref:Uncharacterized protein n=1 Tax=Catharanthus roseus TaxID=4058 RepID=A0ACC0BB45_CATRO|nr:hypothetical protein M9H77_19742 [Catharanthus roseus]